MLEEVGDGSIKEEHPLTVFVIKRIEAAEPGIEALQSQSEFECDIGRMEPVVSISLGVGAALLVILGLRLSVIGGGLLLGNKNHEGVLAQLLEPPLDLVGDEIVVVVLLVVAIVVVGFSGGWSGNGALSGGVMSGGVGMGPIRGGGLRLQCGASVLG